MDDDDDIGFDSGGWGAPGTVPAVLAPVLAALGFLVFAALRGELSSGTALLGILIVGAVGFVAALGLGARVRRRVRRAPEASRTLWPDGGMKLTVEALPEPCYIADSRGRLRFANAAAAAAFGPIQPGDPLSFRLRVPSVLEALDRVSAGGPAEAVAWTEKIPTDRWYEARIVPLRLPGRERRVGDGPDFVFLMIHDQTEQKRTETLRADFVANASHELRTPLASLSGFIETLQGPARKDEVARERFLAIMAEQARRMGRLIDDLLHLSRIEMRAHIRPSALVDLGAVVRTVADGLEPLADENEVVIVRELPESGPVVRGDRDELVQVVENLAENAIKYGAAGKRVVLSCWTDRSGAQPAAIVSVRDFGPGIAPEHQPRLTERFYRVDVATSRSQRGTGLGLSIVKHILARHGGRLSIESQPGKGATFILRLDCAEAPPPAAIDGENAGLSKELHLHKTTIGES
ncbi:two-component system, OmpR family, phosphate regulon sensor histidine kinase PhoR [Pseudoxanthobacter soli DSM 19599]|uniref:histidine kinase n=1 Tax=Pseudoxanthobacter soli DSM 19599 TaxID=1123029 RepID=A0A1M7ZH14_9HYPH|nr:ATP-binding protein [Pseudoxanthobacter soli]SHO64164.1 two-component system, OmpR family, phosphate regulon sensor histidine kinase PhoR [Pseudoxanthobacter soli DSM 19599]